MKASRLISIGIALLLVLATVTGALAQRKVVLWWTMEYSAEEKAALEAIVNDFQKKTGIKVE